MNSVRLRRNIGMLRGEKRLAAHPPAVEWITTRAWKIFSMGCQKPFPQSLRTISLGLKESKNMSSTRNTKSAYVGTGILPPGTVAGSEPSLTSKLSSRQKRLSSMTGKLVKSIQTTTTKNPFIVSHNSANTLLCSACERSTFTLTLESSGRKPSIVTRCSSCGNRGKIVPENSSKLCKTQSK